LDELIANARINNKKIFFIGVVIDLKNIFIQGKINFKRRKYNELSRNLHFGAGSEDLLQQKSPSFSKGASLKRFINLI